MEDLEFIEAHAVVGFGQQWPVYQGNRNLVILDCINQAEQEIDDEFDQ